MLNQDIAAAMTVKLDGTLPPTYQAGIRELPRENLTKSKRCQLAETLDIPESITPTRGGVHGRLKTRGRIYGYDSGPAETISASSAEEYSSLPAGKAFN